MLYAVSRIAFQAATACGSSPPYREVAYEANHSSRSTVPGVQASSVNRAIAAGLLSAPSGIIAIPASALPALSRHFGYWSTQSGALAPIGV